MENNIERKRARAKERIKELKGFYGHLAVYLAVNTFVTGTKIIRNIGNGETFSEAFFDMGTFFVWGAWGIGLAFHAAKTFGFSVFNKEWEERQIQKYMEEDRREAEKYSNPFPDERKTIIMTSIKDNTSKYIRAQKRLQEIKGFYGHLTIYIVINTAITIYKVVKSIKGIEEFWDFGILAVWLFWGLGLLYHASKVYSFNPFFGKAWEERQIKKFLEQDSQL